MDIYNSLYKSARNMYIKMENEVQRKKYIKLYPSPPFDIWKEYSSVKPKVFNSEGREYDYYYLRDVHVAANPYDDTGKYFIWDRYNYGFPIHFYSHQEMFKEIGQPVKKYGMMIESRAIVPRDYELLKKNKGIEKEYEYIFAFDDEILNEYSNARFYPFWASPWYGRKDNLIDDDKCYEKKTKNISFLSSNKVQADVHRKRIALAQYCNNNNLCDVFGKAVGGGYVEIEEPLKDYMFSIVVENLQTDYYFTEKITNCFASQVIPIYYGALKIEEFFNMDGIIKLELKDFDNIDKILKVCTREEYERRLPAILDNYNRVTKEYMNMQDYLYEHYLMN